MEGQKDSVIASEFIPESSDAVDVIRNWILFFIAAGGLKILVKKEIVKQRTSQFKKK